jgi:hypothetical protein
VIVASASHVHRICNAVILRLQKDGANHEKITAALAAALICAASIAQAKGL